MSRVRIETTFFVLCGFFVFSSLATAQEKIREVSTRRPFRGQPVAVVGKDLGSKQFVGGDKVLANKDWLRFLSITFQNISQKNITYISIHLVIAKQGSLESALAVPMLYHPGTEPDAEKPGTTKKRVLMPGSIVNLRVEDKDYEWAESHLRKAGAEDFDRISIDIRRVTFEDGTSWNLGFELPAPISTSSGNGKPLLSFFYSYSLSFARGFQSL